MQYRGPTFAIAPARAQAPTAPYNSLPTTKPATGSPISPPAARCPPPASPSAPYLPRPQVKSSPAAVRAAEWDSPQHTCDHHRGQALVLPRLNQINSVAAAAGAEARQPAAMSNERDSTPPRMAAAQS